MKKKILATIAIGVILTIFILSFFTCSYDISPLQESIDAGTKVYVDYMKKKGITVLDSSKCNGSFQYDSVLVDFGDFVSLVLSDRNIGNRTVYLSWINIENEVKIPKFSYLWVIVVNGSVFKTNWYPTFNVEFDNVDTIQEKINSTTNFYIAKLESEGHTVKIYNDSLGDMWIEWNSFKDFTFFASSKIIYLCYINILLNLRMPIFFYMVYGIKLGYSLYGGEN